MAGLDPTIVDTIENAIDHKVRSASSKSAGPTTGTVTKIDGNGVVWVSAPGMSNAVPIQNFGEAVNVGDEIGFSIAGGYASLLANRTALEKVREAAGNNESFVRQLLTEAEKTDKIVGEIERMSKATNQHFWAKSDNTETYGYGAGAFITDRTQEEWLDGASRDFDDISETNPYSNFLLTSEGALIRRGGTTLASFSRSAVSFLDGLGTGPGHITSYFSDDLARIGRANSLHTEITPYGMSVVDNLEQVAFIGSSGTTTILSEQHEASVELNHDPYTVSIHVTDSPAVEPFPDGFYGMIFRGSLLPEDIFDRGLISSSVVIEDVVYPLYPYHYDPESGDISCPTADDVVHLPEEERAYWLQTLVRQWTNAMSLAAGHSFWMSTSFWNDAVNYKAAVQYSHVDVGDLDAPEASFNAVLKSGVKKVIRVLSSGEDPDPSPLPEAGSGRQDALLVGGVPTVVVGAGNSADALYYETLQELEDRGTMLDLYLAAPEQIEFDVWTVPQRVGQTGDRRRMIYGTGGLGLTYKESGYFLTDRNGMMYPGVYDNGSHLWFGATKGADYHHHGRTILSTGYNPDASTGWDTIQVAVPNASNNGASFHDVWHKGTLPQTAWATLPLSSDCVAYNDYQIPKYRKTGGIVNVCGAVKPKTAVAAQGNMTIGTLPAGFRPVVELHMIGQGSGTSIWDIQVGPSGTIMMRRYRNESGYQQAPTTAWLPFNITFAHA